MSTSRVAPLEQDLEQDDGEQAGRRMGVSEDGYGGTADRRDNRGYTRLATAQGIQASRGRADPESVDNVGDPSKPTAIERDRDSVRERLDGALGPELATMLVSALSTGLLQHRPGGISADPGEPSRTPDP